jgi:hypothetical protein
VPVNSTHPDYDANAFDWLRARDVLAGEDAVKSAGEKYLPRLDSRSDASIHFVGAAIYSSTSAIVFGVSPASNPSGISDHGLGCMS